jgi:hypothetical protein
VRDRVEIFRQIGVNNVGVAPQPVRFLDRIDRAATRSIAISTVLEIRLKERLQHDLCRGLNHPIPDRRDAERSRLPALGSSPAAPVRADTSSRRVSHASPPATHPRPTSRSARKSPVHARHTRIIAGQRVGEECPVGKSCRRANRSGKRAPPSPCNRASSEGYLILSGVSRLIANHPFLTIVESAPEVRVLSSAGITRPGFTRPH